MHLESYPSSQSLSSGIFGSQAVEEGHAYVEYSLQSLCKLPSNRRSSCKSTTCPKKPPTLFPKEAHPFKVNEHQNPKLKNKKASPKIAQPLRRRSSLENDVFVSIGSIRDQGQPRDENSDSDDSTSDEGFGGSTNSSRSTSPTFDTIAEERHTNMFAFGLEDLIEKVSADDSVDVNFASDSESDDVKTTAPPPRTIPRICPTESISLSILPPSQIGVPSLERRCSSDSMILPAVKRTYQMQPLPELTPSRGVVVSSKKPTPPSPQRTPHKMLRHRPASILSAAPVSYGPYDNGLKAARTIGEMRVLTVTKLAKAVSEYDLLRSLLLEQLLDVAESLPQVGRIGQCGTMIRSSIFDEIPSWARPRSA